MVRAFLVQSGKPSSQLHERHDAGDFDTKTQDKLAAAD